MALFMKVHNQIRRKAIILVEKRKIKKSPKLYKDEKMIKTLLLMFQTPNMM